MLGGAQGIAQVLRSAVSEKGVKRVLFLVDIHVRVETKDRRRAGLTVAIHDAHPVAAQSEVLGKVADHRGLADATLEVLDRQNHRRIAVGAVGQGAEHLPHAIHICQAVSGPPARHRVLDWHRQPPIRFGISDQLVTTPHHVGSGADIEPQIECLFAARRIEPITQARNDGVCAVGELIEFFECDAGEGGLLHLCSDLIDGFAES